MTNRTVLMIAYHFPPVRGSSGLQRTLRFAQHLPKFGWRPIVLTVKEDAYESVAPGKGNEVPVGLNVERTWALDAARHLRLGGRYPQFLALPDRWMTWQVSAARAAKRIVRDEGVSVLWSTFPIATAHLIGLRVANSCRLPWVAEFRDPMWQGADYPPDPTVNRNWRTLEQKIFSRASDAVFTTPSARATYAKRFSHFDERRLHLIENGYDEETFQRLSPAARPPPLADRPLMLLHSGIIYPSERDPTHFFQALAMLKKEGEISSRTLRVVLRATGNDELYSAMLSELEIADVVHLAPPIDYLDALSEMVTADGLLVMQAANCNEQIPAKLYEYIRSGRPILALTDPTGDTAKTLTAAGIGRVAELDSLSAIREALLGFLNEVRQGTWTKCPDYLIRKHSRLSATESLAAVLEKAETKK